MAADRSDSPQPALAGTERKTFRPAVKIAAAVLSLAASLILAEVALRVVPHLGVADDTALPGAVNAPVYSQEEQRRDLGRFTQRQGRDCIEIRGGGLHWDPHFGYASKKLNKECARKLFAAHEKSVVLLGGSAMENVQAPNYLTSIDNYAFGGDPSIASLNLAESGARHSNMLFRFLHEIVELHPTYAVFLDGFNEFASVHYGGEPEDDFYWTAGVKDRVERPLIFLRDKLVDSSRLMQWLAATTGFINSARMVHSHIDMGSVIAAADYYLKMRDYTKTICDAYGIKCIFMVQPAVFLQKTPTDYDKLIIRKDLQSFPTDIEVFRTGYDRILRGAGDKVLDATHLFEGKGDVFIDIVHFNKVGSKLIGDTIRAALH